MNEMDQPTLMIQESTRGLHLDVREAPYLAAGRRHKMQDVSCCQGKSRYDNNTRMKVEPSAMKSKQMNERACTSPE